LRSIRKLGVSEEKTGALEARRFENERVMEWDLRTCHELKWGERKTKNSIKMKGREFKGEERSDTNRDILRKGGAGGRGKFENGERVGERIT